MMELLAVLMGGAVERAKRRDEQGSVTIEQVLWAVAVIIIVGIVVAAITAYVTSQSEKIN